MAVLSAADRRSMPASQFGGPHKSFPMNDKTHDRLAISGATRSERAGNISESEADKIKSEARSKLGEADPHKEHRVAVAKMHPKHVHELVKHAMTGKAGPEAKQMAGMAMQDGGGDSSQGAQDGKDYSSIFSGGSGGGAPAAPPSGGSPFGGN